jgi:uncharacterized membrane protein YfcA
MVGGLDPRYTVAGWCVGAFVGLTGVGGGSLMTPLLILLFGMHPAAAVGTDLLFAAITNVFGTAVHGYTHTVDWRVVRRLAAGSVPATALTLVVLSHFDLGGAAAARLISLSLGAALLATAVIIVFRPWLVALVDARLGEPDPRRTAILSVIGGALLGILVSVSSVGAGAIGATVLILLYRRLPTPRIVGSDIAHAVPLTLIAGCGHWLLGSVDLAILGSLLTGSIPGIVLGSWTTVRVPDRPLRLVLAAVLLAAGSRLLM